MSYTFSNITQYITSHFCCLLRLTTLSVLLLSSAFPIISASHNSAARLALKKVPTEAITADSHHLTPQKDAPEYIPLIVKLTHSDATLPDTFNEWHRRGNLVIGSIETTDLGILDELPFVSRVEASSLLLPTMDQASLQCNLENIRASYQETGMGKGKNVITGFCDIGFDAKHITFFDNDGNTRVKKLVKYDRSHPFPEISTDAAQVTSSTIDSFDECHATHVCGIMSGSYDGGFGHGVAPEADIVATVSSTLDEAYVLAGCEEIIAQAQAEGKPAVINISLSNTDGPHDGTSLFNQYMSYLTDDATICVSAGNDGQRPGYISHTFTNPTNPIRTYLRHWASYSTLKAYGSVGIWSNDDKPLKVGIARYDMQKLTQKESWGPFDLSDNKEAVLCSEDLADNFSSADVHLLPEGFKGYIFLTAEINPENLRYNVSIICNIVDTTTNDPYQARELFGPEIFGEKGQSVEITSSSSIFLSHERAEHALRGTPFNCVNDWGTAEGVICVGAFTSRNECIMANGDYMNWANLTVNTPSYFSSYGVSASGEILPHVSAPGARVVSALSTEFYDAHPDQIISDVSLIREINGTRYLWGPQQGTSMSSPFAAGSIALWLEQYPELSGKDTKAILLQTIAQPEINPEDAQWGQGKLDIKAGLKLAAERSSIKQNVDSDFLNNECLTIRQSHNNLLEVETNGPLSGITVTDMTGRLLHTRNGINNHRVSLHLEHSGIIIVSATLCSGQTLHKKVALR